jgi:hypothetical protein
LTTQGLGVRLVRCAGTPNGGVRDDARRRPTTEAQPEDAPVV